MVEQKLEQDVMTRQAKRCVQSTLRGGQLQGVWRLNNVNKRDDRFFDPLPGDELRLWSGSASGVSRGGCCAVLLGADVLARLQVT